MNSSGRLNKSAPEPHLVFISYYFPPMGGGGVQRITKFLKYFDYQAFRVSVLTVRPSFFYSSDPSLEKDIPSPVTVIRSGSLDPFRLIYLFQKIRYKLFPRGASEKAASNESGGKLRKIAMSLFVPDSRLLWFPFAVVKLIAYLRRHPAHLIIATMPPFTAGIIAVVVKKVAGIPVVLDFRDAWSNNPYLPRIAPLQQHLSRALERFCMQHADGFIFVNPALHADYQERFPVVNQHSNITIRNGYDPDDFAELNIENRSPSSLPFRLGIMGTVYSQGNRPISLLKAINELQQENTDLEKQFKLVFLGKWSSDFLEQVNDFHLPGIVQFHSYLPHRAALQTAAGFNALALAIESRFPGAAQVTPGRIYEYLSLRKPILAMCPLESDVARLVRECHAGEVVPDTDVAAIKTVLREWLANPDSLKSRYTFSGVEQFSREQQTGELMGFLGELLRG